MEKYERAYRQAFLDAARKADPDWEVGKPVKSGALDGITRESVEANMKVSRLQRSFVRNCNLMGHV